MRNRHPAGLRAVLELEMGAALGHQDPASSALITSRLFMCIYAHSLEIFNAHEAHDWRADQAPAQAPLRWSSIHRLTCSTLATQAGMASFGGGMLNTTRASSASPRR